jgi:hypothetical protein
MPIGPHLEAVSKARRLTTYQDLVSAFPTILPALDGAWSAHPLSRIFEVLDQDDALHGRPFRTSVAFAKATGEPRGGYFEALGRLKGVNCQNAAARQAAWIAELNAAHAFAWP